MKIIISPAKSLNFETKAPTEDRRDDMRFQLRAKISQKDYCDKNMKNFHYNKEKQPLTTLMELAQKDVNNVDRLELLKKQIS